MWWHLSKHPSAVCQRHYKTRCMARAHNGDDTRGLGKICQNSFTLKTHLTPTEAWRSISGTQRYKFWNTAHSPNIKSFNNKNLLLVTIYPMPVTLTLKQTSFGAPHTEMLWKIFSFLLDKLSTKKTLSVKLYPSLCVYENSGDWLNVANSDIRSRSARDKLFMYHVWLCTVINIKHLLVQI